MEAIFCSVIIMAMAIMAAVHQKPMKRKTEYDKFIEIKNYQKN